MLIFWSRAPILYVKGRTYPVDVYHATEDHEEDRVDAALKQCFQLHVTKPPGDILVFMPGMLYNDLPLDGSNVLVLGHRSRGNRGSGEELATV